MKKTLLILSLLLCIVEISARSKKHIEPPKWPDGTEIDTWFNDTSRVDVSTLGKQYVITDFGVQPDSTILQTTVIQSVIDLCASEGGGVVVIPEGTFLTGALFFKQGTHLHIKDGGKIKGSDRIANFPIVKTRLEGRTIQYFAALINVDNCDGFTLSGKGTIDGNGYNYWEEFWLRRKFNPQCTNLDAMRPRLVYISNCRNVTVQDVHLMNSPFWTNHLYRCDHVRYLYCYIYAPTEGIKAPSSDALDLDVCHDILVHGCFMHVCDDAVVLKGGKGTFADQDPHNGPVERVIVEDCTYGWVAGCLTCGSECLHARNIIVRRIDSQRASRGLWLKMRPDTPQHYEYIRMEDVRGHVDKFLVIRPWTQFYNLEDRPDMPVSRINNITMKHIQVESPQMKDVQESDQYVMDPVQWED